jgi:DNA-binding transcriptional ArsR family regulator
MESKDAVRALAALAQETRLSIFRMLVEAGPQGVPAGQISGTLAVGSTTLSFHLKELTHAALISARQDGRFIYYSADFERMAALMSYLTRNCCRGMPEKCLTVMETALDSCCAPQPKRKLKRSTA